MNCMLTLAAIAAAQPVCKLTPKLKVTSMKYRSISMMNSHLTTTWKIRIERWINEHVSFTPIID